MRWTCALAAVTASLFVVWSAAPSRGRTVVAPPAGADILSADRLLRANVPVEALAGLACDSRPEFWRSGVLALSWLDTPAASQALAEAAHDPVKASFAAAAREVDRRTSTSSP